MKKNIAIVAGGDSSEIVISLKSAEGIYSFIDKDKYNLYIAIVKKDEWSVRLPNGEHTPIDKNDFSFFENGEKKRFDFAYITIHGTPGEDGRLQGYFDLIGLPYSSCGMLVSALTFNKYVCNHYLNNFGVRIAVTKVKEISALPAAIDKAFAEGKEVVIESFIEGTEVTCGCYKVKGKEVVFPVTEVVTSNEFFDFDAKYNGQVQEITPARISPEWTKKVQSETSRIYDLLGAKGLIRVDYIIPADGEPCLLEINTTPGMTGTSFIPQQVRAAGLNITDVMNDIIENEIN